MGNPSSPEPEDRIHTMTTGAAETRVTGDVPGRTESTAERERFGAARPATPPKTAAPKATTTEAKDEGAKIACPACEDGAVADQPWLNGSKKFECEHCGTEVAARAEVTFTKDEISLARRRAKRADAKDADAED